MKLKKFAYIFIITAFSVVFNLLILIFPEKTIISASKGLLIWYNSALPSLLPFIISINLLKNTAAPYLIAKLAEPFTKRAFKILGIGTFPIVMGMLSGYPLGAKLCCELYLDKKIAKNEAQRILCFCNNSGPLFILGTLGTLILKSSKTGYFLMFVHYISAIVLGIILSIGKKPNCSIKTSYNSSYTISEILSNTITNSISTIVTIGGYIVLFSIITGYFPSFNNDILNTLIKGIFEITGGSYCIKNTDITSLSVLSAITAWGGLSIHSQAMSYIKATDLSILKYILSKLLHSLLAVFICILFYPIYAQKLSW